MIPWRKSESNQISKKSFLFRSYLFLCLCTLLSVKDSYMYQRLICIYVRKRQLNIIVLNYKHWIIKVYPLSYCIIKQPTIYTILNHDLWRQARDKYNVEYTIYYWWLKIAMTFHGIFHRKRGKKAFKTMRFERVFDLLIFRKCVT